MLFFLGETGRIEKQKVKEEEKIMPEKDIKGE